MKQDIILTLLTTLAFAVPIAALLGIRYLSKMSDILDNAIENEMKGYKSNAASTRSSTFKEKAPDSLIK